jgi:cobalt-zinc-cadmium efflux system protein
MSTTETALTAHVVIPAVANHDDWLARVESELASRFEVGHVTIQIEAGGGSHICSLTAEGAV